MGSDRTGCNGFGLEDNMLNSLVVSIGKIECKHLLMWHEAFELHLLVCWFIEGSTPLDELTCIASLEKC